MRFSASHDEFLNAVLFSDRTNPTFETFIASLDVYHETAFSGGRVFHDSIEERLRVCEHLQGNTMSKNIFQVMPHYVGIVRRICKGIGFSTKNTPRYSSNLVRSVV